SKIAVAGGAARSAGCEQTNACGDAGNAAHFETDLKKALDAIRQQAFSCTFNVPGVVSGKNGPASVKLKITVAGKTVTISLDTTHTGGWDFLPGSQQVQLFGEACDLINALGAKLEIVLGCG